MKFKIFGADNTALGTGTSALYNFIAATHQSSWNATEANRDTPVAKAITLRAMKVRISTAPGSGDTRVFTVMVNGSATGCTVTISDTNTDAEVTGLSVSVAQGDTISFESTATGTPDDTTDVYWEITAESVGSDYVVLFGGTGTNVSSNISTVWQQLMNGTGTWLDTSSARADAPMPVAGDFTDIYASISGTPGTGNEYNFALWHNGSASALSINFANSETGIKSDSGTVSISLGDAVCVGAEPISAPSSRQFSWSTAFTPTTAGQAPILFGSNDAPANGGTEFEQPFGGGNNSWIATEANRYGMLGAIQAQAIYIRVGTAPGSGKSWAVTLREESADTSATVTVSDANTTANASFTVDLNSGSRHNWESTPSGSPSIMSGGLHIGLRYTVPSSGTDYLEEPTDSVTMSDAIVKNVVKNLTDSTSNSETISKTVTKALTDTATPADQISNKPQKNLTDSVTMSDAETKNIVKNIADSVTMADEVSRVWEAILSLADTATPSDTISKTVVKNLTDTATPEDVISNRPTKALTDSVAMSDTIVNKPQKNVADSVTTSDEVSHTWEAIKSLTDEVTPSDALSKTVGKTLTDSVTPADEITTTSGTGLSLEDSVTMSDALSKTVVKNLTDSATATDTQAKTVTKALTDTATPSDTQAKSVVKGLTDTTSLSDTQAKTVTKALIDTATATESASKTVVKALTDSVTMSDQVTTDHQGPGAGLQKPLADTVTVTDVIRKIATKVLGDSISFSESLRILINGAVPSWYVEAPVSYQTKQTGTWYEEAGSSYYAKQTGGWYNENETQYQQAGESEI